MVEISPQTLVMAIQAVDQMIQELTCDVSPQDLECAEAELYLSLWKSAVDMKNAYTEAQKKYLNLPPYEQLAKHT